MPSPFPGMDPYLEHPALWPDLHLSLIPALRDVLAPQLRPRYYVAVETRVFVAEPAAEQLVGVPDGAVIAAGHSPGGSPTIGPLEGAGSSAGPQAAPQVGVLDVEVPVPARVRQTYLEIRDPREHEVVTVIELLSPTNKRPGEGRQEYLAKRRQTLASLTSLVEVDLLRGGQRMPIWLDGRPAPEPLPGDYRVLVARGEQRPQARLYPFAVRDPIPAFPLPLRSGDEEPTIDLQPLLAAIYDRASYDLRIDYRQDAVPPLRGDDAVWAADLLHRAGRR